LAATLRARRSTPADKPLFITTKPRLLLSETGRFHVRAFFFETTLKDLMNPAPASKTFFIPTNLQLRRTQQWRIGAGRFEPIATIFWALASLIAASVAAFA
jgi:hypothetical protein